MKKSVTALLLFALALSTSPAWAADYIFDIKGAHAFIQFRIKHLGYSWLIGRFNSFNGRFSYDERNPSASTFEVTVDTASIDSNHAERDKHLRGKKFLHVAKYPKAHFISSSFEEMGYGKVELRGDLTLHGVTRPIIIAAEHIGHGKDPWGGYRRGFAGTTTLTLKAFEIERDLGPASRQVEMSLYVEGIRTD